MGENSMTILKYKDEDGNWRAFSNTTIGNADTLDGMTVQQLKDSTYPVGTEYVNYTDGTNPSILLSMPWSTWVAVEDTFTLGAGDKAAGTIGGEAEHTLTEDEMPSHGHGLRAHSALGNNQNAVSRSIAGNHTTSSVSFRAGQGDGLMHSSQVVPSGGGQAHNNMPPYRVAYKWERTA